MTFEDYTRAHLASLLRLAGVLAGESHLAEDVVQEVLVRAARHWDRVAASSSPDAYVRRMVVNEYLSWRRKWARIVPRADVVPRQSVPDHADRYADRDELSQRLGRLPAQQRAVLVLRYYEDLADDEIAKILGCVPGTVRSHASRALAALRVQMSQPLLQPVRKDT